jgi:hypothetical protein
MNIIMISGGLGNQMFQYALCLAIRQKGHQVKIDISKYNYYQIHNNYELKDIFGIEGEVASPEEIKKSGYTRDNRITRLLRKSIFRKKSTYNERNIGFDSEVFEVNNRYIYGYWQSEKYFIDIKSIVCETYVFPELNSKKLEMYSKQMKESNSVSIHIRRGDYLNHPLYKGICEKDYYQRAIKYIIKVLGNDVLFFVFSNDMNWVKTNLNIKNAVYVEGNIKKDSFRDMQLMSMCKNNIIANSSFSWWGAWLNQNPEKIVIAPTKWVNDKNKNCDDIIPNGWIKV